MRCSGSAAANNYIGSTTAILRSDFRQDIRSRRGKSLTGRCRDISKDNEKRSLAWCCRVGVALRGTASLAEPRVALLSPFSPSPLHRKSQAAMEFLMTYGWAILVVLAAIVALAYFGVLSPSRFLPESCTLPSTSGIACLDFTLTPSSANLFLANGGGRDLWVNSIEVGSCSVLFNQAFPDGASHLFVLSGCDFGSAGQKLKLPFVVSYSDITSNFTKSASGSITAGLS